jgi:hypothetical protein
VADDGMGIAPEVLPRIFQLFAQGERTLDRSEGGLGIGLTVVKKLVELHGGTVVAYSDGLGQGSEFMVRLPALPGAPARPPVINGVNQPGPGLLPCPHCGRQPGRGRELSRAPSTAGPRAPDSL